MFERRDVWALSNEQVWHPVLEWYARAVEDMQSRDGSTFQDPICWRYFAETHGTDIAKPQRPPGVRWNICEHGSWFFLPWHRLYLWHFEKTVRARVSALGGPSDWALPYWDYSSATNPLARTLPPAFREPEMPNGRRNPLFITERAPEVNQGTALLKSDVSVSDAIKVHEFTSTTAAGFGGGRIAALAHSGPRPGVLEAVPHATVHTAIGGLEPMGFMSRFETAARDPIFWLHHANLDRVWEAWLQLGQGRSNPTAGQWLTQSFTIGSAANVTTLTVGEVVHTADAPLSYRYSELGLGVPTPPVLANAVDLEELEVAVNDFPPEVVGASDGPVPLGTQRSHVDIPVEAPTGPVAAAIVAPDVLPPRVFLRVENVRGSKLSAGAYHVYLNVPPGEDPAQHQDRRVGLVPTFGVIEASRESDNHDGSGLTFALDVTDVARRLREAGDWNPQRVRVTFEPQPDTAGAVHPGDVRAGRVSVYYG